MNRYRLTVLDSCPPAAVPASCEDFLAQLGGPTLIRLSGRDRSRCRVVNTLLHGNEPSGARAVHRFLREGQVPATDLLVFVISVAAALAEPLFSHRQLPGERDMNRCFRAPFDGDQGRLAADILAAMDRSRPEAVVDIHNTSGDGPSFAVCTEDRPVYYRLAGHFSHRLVVTDLRLGALMENTRDDRPIITVECGGAREGAADLLAWQGLRRYTETEDLFADAPVEFDLYRHPVRLELQDGATIAYAEEPHPTADITLSERIDRRNFGVVARDTAIAWIRDPGCIRVRNADGGIPLEDFFEVRNGSLYPVRELKLFMVTTNPIIARDDCLLYAVREDCHDRAAE